VNVFVQMLHENSSELQTAVARRRPAAPVSEEVISQIVAMGFDADTVRAALHHLGSDIEQVVAELVQRAGTIPDEWYHALAASQQPAAARTTSTDSNSSGSGRSPPLPHFHLYPQAEL